VEGLEAIDTLNINIYDVYGTGTEAYNISALVLATTHEGALLLVTDQPPLLRCFA